MPIVLEIVLGAILPDAPRRNRILSDALAIDPGRVGEIYVIKLEQVNNNWVWNLYGPGGDGGAGD